MTVTVKAPESDVLFRDRVMFVAAHRCAAP
jgi:hypothetical protein